VILPKCFFASLLVSLSLCAQPSFASSAPPESDDESLSVYLQSLNQSRSFGDGFVHFNTPMPDYEVRELSNGTQTPYDSAKAYFSVKASPFPYVASYAYAIDSPGFDATGSGVEASARFSLAYWAEVVGPAGKLVTVDAIVNQGALNSVSTYINKPSFASAVGSPSVEITADSPDETQIGITGSGRSETKFRQLTDAWFEVQMYTSAGANVQDGAATAVVWTDPQFVIDPSTPDANLFSIVPGDDFGNAPAAGVPEPSTWAMLLLGFAGLGALAYRRNEAAAGQPKHRASTIAARASPR
jgi:PEP-CTERM motif